MSTHLDDLDPRKDTSPTPAPPTDDAETRIEHGDADLTPARAVTLRAVTWHRLASALESAALAPDVASPEAREAVAEAVLELRARGLPPESALAHMKATARRLLAGVQSPADSHALDAVLARVVKWTIETYYEPGGRAD